MPCCWLLRLGLFLLAFASTSHASPWPSGISSDIPRRDFFGRHVSGQFTPSKEYLESLIVLAIPFAAIGFIGFLIVCAIVTWKIFVEKKDDQVMHQIDISWRAGVFFVMISTLLVGVCVGLLGANTVFHGAMKDLANVLESSSGELLVRGTATMDLIERTNLTMITKTKNIMDIYYTARGALETVTDKKQLFTDVEDLRYACIASACTVIIVGCMFVIHTLLQGSDPRSSAFSWSATYGKQAMVGVVAFAFLQSALWSGSGLHTSISVLSADLCDASNNLQQSLVVPISNALGADPGALTDYVDYFAYCNQSAPFASTLDAVHSVITDLQKKINASIANHTLPPETIQVLQNNTIQLATIMQSFDHLVSCSVISALYYSTQQLICVNTLNSGFVAAMIMAGIGLMSLVVALYICRLMCVHTSRPKYTLVGDT